MIVNLLAPMREVISIPDALVYALIGFAFVFVGIVVLIGVVALVGLVMQKTDGNLLNLFKKKNTPEPKIEATTAVTPVTDEIPDEVKAAIVAAIMAYYQTEKPECEFVVRKIKKI